VKIWGVSKDREFLDERVKYQLCKDSIQLRVFSGFRHGLNEIFSIF
jgi:hypothetical protein